MGMKSIRERRPREAPVGERGGRVDAFVGTGDGTDFCQVGG